MESRSRERIGTEIGDGRSSSPEIAVIPEAANNTIKKHVQNIFQKLGVENRTAAALRALEVIGLPEGGS